MTERVPWPLAAVPWLVCWFLCFNAVASLMTGALVLAFYAAALTWFTALCAAKIEGTCR